MLLQASDDMITIHHPNGKYLYYNGPICYTIKAEDIVGKMPNDLFNKDISDTLMETFKKVKETGKSETIEVLLDWLGEKKWFSEYIYPFKNAEGEVIEIVKVCKDIHQRKIAEQEIENQNKALIKSEKALKASNEEYLKLNKELHKSNKKLSTAKGIIEKSEANLRTLMNTIPDLIWLKSVDGKYLFVNNRFEDFFGAKEQAIIGKTDYDFVDKELAESFREHDKNAMFNGAPTINEEYIVFANDNHGELLETTKVPVLSKDKDIIGVLGIGKDITEKRKAEKALKASNEEYLQLNKELNASNKQLSAAKAILEKSELNLRTLINTIPDLIWLKSIDGRYLFINNRTEDFFGAKEKNIIEKIDHDFVDKELADSFRKSDRLAIKNGVPIINEQLLTFANDNHSELLKITKVPVLSKDKEILGVLGIGHDITEQRKAEKELEAKTAKLDELNKSLNLAQKISNVGNWEWNIELDEAEWSDEMYQIYGVKKGAFYPSYKNILQTILPKDINNVEQGLSLLLNDKPFVSLEFRIQRPSGEIRDLLLLSAEKKSKHIIFGVTKDITLQKKREKEKLNYLLNLEITKKELILEKEKAESNEKKLKKANKRYQLFNEALNKSNKELINVKNKIKDSEVKFRAIFDHSTDAIVVTKNGIGVLFNSAYLKLFGYESLNDLIGKKVINQVSEKEREKVTNLIVNRNKGISKSISYESVGLKKNGEEFNYEISVSPYTLENKRYSLGIIRDITERKLTQNELEIKTLKLKELNKSLNQAQKISNTGNWEWHIDSDTAVWSDEMYKIYGVSKDTFYPSHKNVAKTILPADTAKVEQGINSLLNGKIFAPFEFRIKRPSGEVRNVLVISIEKKSDFSFFGVTKDITNQKKIEGEKLKAAFKLEKTKNELNEAQKLAQIGSWLLHPTNKKMKWSEETFHIWGFDPNQNIPKYTKIIKLIHSDDVELFNNSVNEASMMGTPFDIKFRVSIPNQGKKVIKSICKPVLDDSGNVMHLKGTNQDITAQVKQQEKVLSFGAESRAMKSAVDAGWSSAEFSIDGTILKANKNFVTDFGYSSQKEIIGKHHKIFYESDYENSDNYEDFWKNLASGKEQKGEFKRIKKDGNSIWINANYTPVKDINGTYYKVIKIANNISEMVKNRFEVTAIANELRQFIETANAPIFGIDNQGLVNEWNQTSEKITGFKKEEVLGKGLVETYINKDYQKSVKQVLDNALLGKETTNYEFPLFAKNGTRVMVLLNSSTRRDMDGHIIGVLGVGQDITQIDNLRTISVSIAKELRQFIETANAPIFGIDYQGNINEWNQTSEKITGFKKEEVLGKDLVETYITRDYQKAVRKVLDDALLGKETANYELPLFAKNGTRVMILFNSSTRRDTNGHITGVLGVGQDITELDSYRNELEIKVNERTLKLNESLEKQKELNELKSRFVSTASHEFRTPLSAINFAAGSIKKYWTKMEPVMIDKKLHKIEDQVLHMTKLLDDVLVVGQADVGKMLNKPISINLGNFIYEIIEEINNSRNKSHEIVLIDDADLIKSSIYIDEKLGRNIFINLLDNALKFSPDAKKVIVELVSEKKYTVITIQDFGIGIPELELENIFTPFTRGENVDLIQGTGLGLSIVKEAVKLAGGEINVKSTVKNGTTFIVKIPQNINSINGV